jgi:hypothetical protein
MAIKGIKLWRDPSEIDEEINRLADDCLKMSLKARERNEPEYEHDFFTVRTALIQVSEFARGNSRRCRFADDTYQEDEEGESRLKERKK